MSVSDGKVYVGVVRAPTTETLRNIVHSVRLKNAALKRSLERRLKEARTAGPFNPIRGIEALATVKVQSK